MGKIEFKNIDLSIMEMNEGQIEGLDKNPRQWTYDDVEKLKKSIEQTPELLEARGIIVVEHDFRYVAIGGNMRLTALRSLGAKEAPCIVMPKDTPIETLQEIVIKDNGSFGRWDAALLKKDWSECPFADWGIDVFDFESENEQQKSEKPKDYIDDGKSEFAIVLDAEEFEYVNCSLREYDKDPSEAFLNVMGYYE